MYALQNHPLMPKDVTIRGFIMNSETGELKAVEEVKNNAEIHDG